MARKRRKQSMKMGKMSMVGGDMGSTDMGTFMPMSTPKKKTRRRKKRSRK